MQREQIGRGVEAKRSRGNSGKGERELSCNWGV